MLVFLKTNPITPINNKSLSFKNNSYNRSDEIKNDVFIKQPTPETKNTEADIFEVLSSIKNSSQNREYAKLLRAKGEKLADKYFDNIKSILPDEILNNQNETLLLKRIKNEKSIWNKLNKISKTTKIDSYEKADREIKDLIGVRLVLNGSDKEINTIVDSIVTAIKSDKITITEINNYAPENSKPYLSDKQISKIVKASKDKGIETKVLTGKDGIKVSGYTAAQFNFGEYGEFQIMGTECFKTFLLEHQLYDLYSKKDITYGIKSLEDLYSPIKESLKKMSPDDIALFRKYTTEYYRYSRCLELNKPTSKPEFPKKFNPILDFENLEKVYSEATKIKDNIIKKIIEDEIV